MSQFLPQDELIALTGKKRPSAQVRALRSMGIEHKVRPDGKVVVLQAHVDRVLDRTVENRENCRIEPKWELM